MAPALTVEDGSGGWISKVGRNVGDASRSDRHEDCSSLELPTVGGGDSEVRLVNLVVGYIRFRGGGGSRYTVGVMSIRPRVEVANRGDGAVLDDVVERETGDDVFLNEVVEELGRWGEVVGHVA